MSDEIPPSKWYHVVDKLTRMDELLEEILKEIRGLRQDITMTAPPPPTPTAPTVVRERVPVLPSQKLDEIVLTLRRIERYIKPQDSYAMIAVYLGEKHENKEIEMPFSVRNMVVYDITGYVYVAINDARNYKLYLTPDHKGTTFENMDIRRLYITNDAQPNKYVQFIITGVI